MGKKLSKAEKAAKRREARKNGSDRVHGDQSQGLRAKLKKAIESDDELRKEIADSLRMKPTALFKLATGSKPIPAHQRPAIETALQEHNQAMGG